MADPFVEILGPLSRLRVHLEQDLAQRGLRLQYLGVLPAATSLGAHQVQLLVTLAEAPSRAVADDGFEEVLRGAAAAELKLRTQETMEDLRRRIDDEGFL